MEMREEEKRKDFIEKVSIRQAKEKAGQPKQKELQVSKSLVVSLDWADEGASCKKMEYSTDRQNLLRRQTSTLLAFLWHITEHSPGSSTSGCCCSLIT